jgi:hypothetical protein
VNAPVPDHGAAARRAVIVVGGAGFFGGKLVQGLLATTEFPVVVAGRDMGRARRFASSLGAGERVTVARLDTRRTIPEELRALGGFALVDAAGPFQGADHRLAEAAIAAGLHYLDLADGRSFVSGIARLDAAARRAGVVALSGASSTPALSHAALDSLVRGWRGVESVDVAICPGNRATPNGASVVRSILSYVGQPVRVFVDGRWQARPGWGLTVRREIPCLGRRFLSLCETPDLDLLPERFAVRRSALFRAGLEVPALHLGLLLASLPVRRGWVRSLAPWTPAFRFGAGLLSRLGGDTGGMEVAAEGADRDGAPVRARWVLVATGGDGPVVPTLPALAVLRALAAGRGPKPGAGPCVGHLDLAAIEAEFRPYRITTRVHVDRGGSESLIAAALGPAFEPLPAAIRRAHTPRGTLRLSGEAAVEGAETAPGRWIARVFGFPPAADAVPVEVEIAATPEGEHWTRSFGGRCFRSRMRPHERPGFIREGFGPFSFDLALSADAEELRMRVDGWRLGRLPLPRRLAPRSEARETVDAAGRFRFEVPIRLPLLGRLVRYSGWLVPAPAEEDRLLHRAGIGHAGRDGRTASWMDPPTPTTAPPSRSATSSSCSTSTSASPTSRPRPPSTSAASG